MKKLLVILSLAFVMPSIADTDYTTNNSYNNSCTIDLLGVSSGQTGIAYATFEANTYNCSAGYYLPANVDECTLCLANNICSGGTYTFNETISQGIQSCASGTFSPTGSSVCYPHIIHVGNNNVIYLKSNKQSYPSLNVKIGQDTFYANMSTIRMTMNKDSTNYFHVQWGNNDYYVCDDTMYGTYDFSTLDASIRGTDHAYNNEARTWKVTFPYGVMSGKALCSSTPGTDSVAGNPDLTESYQYCWCKATEFMPKDDNQVYGNASVSAWVFRYDNESAYYCNAYCPFYCAGAVKLFPDFRRAIFGVR